MTAGPPGIADLWQHGRWSVRHVEESDHDSWVSLFEGYATFYKRTLTADDFRTVWRWIREDRTTIALVVVGEESGYRPVGLAHLRGWRRPLWASEHGYLDDLFVAPGARGTGAVDALFAGIRELALQRRWQVVRWTTADDNHRAQAVYARYADRTSWVTYDEYIE